MSVVTLADRELLVIVEDGAPEEEWHEGRDEGVTASEIRGIANGSRKRWRTILDGKLNGSTFRGNASTEAGHAAEPEIIRECQALPGVVALAASHALFGSHLNPLHRATPDGLGIHEQIGEFGAEVKNHQPGWTSEEIPAEHADQMQWGMYVTGFSWWLYAWRVEGVEGISHRWVMRDDARIARLVHQADSFIAWRAAGAPELDEIPDEVDDALAEYAEGMRLAAEGETLKKSSRPVIDAFALKQAQADEPLRKSGSRAALFFQPKPDAVVLDEAAWAAAEPETHAEYLALKKRVADVEAAALLLYNTTKPVAATFRVTRNGDTK